MTPHAGSLALPFSFPLHPCLVNDSPPTTPFAPRALLPINSNFHHCECLRSPLDPVHSPRVPCLDIIVSSVLRTNLTPPSIRKKSSIKLKVTEERRRSRPNHFSPLPTPVPSQASRSSSGLSAGKCTKQLVEREG